MDAVQAGLAEVLDPCSVASGVPLSLLDMNLVDRVELDATSVTVWIRLTEPTCMYSFQIAQDVGERVGAALQGRVDVRVRLTAFDPGHIWTEEELTPGERERLREFRENRRREVVRLEYTDSG